ncbi:extensin-2 [Oryzias melastigma]|uniref:extensin-2 n=1 Tax=Oryzias melastigma TaxID=30732 RepID=UPI000CF7FA9D|nr:extensin-2 [Oryzias melastigma]
MAPRPLRAPSEHVRPCTLQIPVVSFSGAPPELSPRFVDGIETESVSGLSQRFEFSPDPPPHPGIQETTEIKRSVCQLTGEVNSLSKQVSRLSQELQEMSRLLKPLLLQKAPPPSQSSAGPLLSSSCQLAPPPCALQKPQFHSLLDGGDGGVVDLQGCLAPTKNPNTPLASTLPPPEHTGGSPPNDGRYPGNSLESQSPPSSYELLLLSLEQPPLASHPPSPSLSVSPSSSSCQSPHPSHSSSQPRPPPFPDSPPALACGRSAPASLTSSPGRRQPPTGPSHLPAASLCPSSLSLPLDLVMRTEPPPSCDSQLEVERQEPWWEGGGSSTQHISFIDEE